MIKMLVLVLTAPVLAALQLSGIVNWLQYLDQFTTTIYQILASF